MKTLSHSLSVGAILASLVFAGVAFAQTPPTLETCKTVTWDANTEPDLAGYKMYVRKDGVGLPAKDIPHPADGASCVFLGIVDDALYILQLTALDTFGNESAATPTLSFFLKEAGVVPPIATPTNFCVHGTLGGNPLFNVCVVVP